MANPNGNPGNKGGGRKSAFQEKADAQRLWKIWTTPGLLQQIQSRIKAGKASAEDAFIAKGFLEDMRPFIEIFKKLYPDRMDFTTKGEPIKGFNYLMPRDADDKPSA